MHRFKQQMMLLLTAVVLAVAFVSGASAQALKIGYVKDDDIKKSYKAWNRAQEQWEAEKKVWDSTAQARSTELQTMMDDYDKQRLILSDEKKRERESAIRTKQDALNQYTQQVYGPEGIAEKKQAELVGPLLDNINKAIQQLATDEGFDIIFTQMSGIAYMKPTYDVTPKVLDYLEKLEK